MLWWCIVNIKINLEDFGVNGEIDIFDGIKQEDEHIGEYWSARDLQKTLGYAKWERFEAVIAKAIISFQNSELTRRYNINDHFPQVGKMVRTGSGAERKVKDYLLSRYACYLIAQNADATKPEVALAQSYFRLNRLEKRN